MHQEQNKNVNTFYLPDEFHDQYSQTKIELWSKQVVCTKQYNDDLEKPKHLVLQSQKE